MKNDRKHFLKNWNKWDYLYWGTALLPYLISALFYSRLPEQVPSHWNYNGEVDSYSSKLFACIGFPSIMLALILMVNALLHFDPRKENIRRSKEMLQISRWFIVALGVICQLAMLLTAVGVNVNIRLVISIPIALIIMVMGNFMPKCRQNYVMGIKLPWTLADEDNWNRTHRLAGYVWTAGGFVMLAAALFKLNVLFFASAVVIVLIPTIYSFLLYRKAHS